jgi:hypothetical protein
MPGCREHKSTQGAEERAVVCAQLRGHRVLCRCHGRVMWLIGQVLPFPGLCSLAHRTATTTGARAPRKRDISSVSSKVRDLLFLTVRRGRIRCGMRQESTRKIDKLPRDWSHG